LAQQIDLRQALIYKPVWYSTGSALGAIALLLLLAIVVPGNYVHIAAERIFNPFGGALWPKRVNIAMLDTPPARVPVGQRVPVRMQLIRGDRPSLRATIFYRYDDGPIHKELMSRGPDGTYSASLDTRIDPAASQGNLQIWIESGDDRHDLPPIVVVPRLQIERVQAILTPPPYAPQRTSTVDLTAAPAVMTAGSQIALQITFNKPLDPESAVRIEPVDDTIAPQFAWQLA